MYTRPYLSLFKYLFMCVCILRKNNVNTYEMLSLCYGVIKYFLFVYTFILIKYCLIIKKKQQN